MRLYIREKIFKGLWDRNSSTETNGALLIAMQFQFFNDNWFFQKKNNCYTLQKNDFFMYLHLTSTKTKYIPFFSLKSNYFFDKIQINNSTNGIIFAI